MRHRMGPRNPVGYVKCSESFQKWSLNSPYVNSVEVKRVLVATVTNFMAHPVYIYM